jgi:hypothetical protein
VSTWQDKFRDPYSYWVPLRKAHAPFGSGMPTSTGWVDAHETRR